MINIATHNAPSWGPRSDFIICADLGNHGLKGRFEQLWARRIGTTTFEICCIPFFTYGLALGDKVETNAEYTIQKVTEKGGHKTLRIAVASKDKRDELHEALREWVENTGLPYEWRSSGYLAVDLPPEAQGTLSISALEHLSRNGEVSLELDE